MSLDDNLKIIKLIDTYGELLTDKQYKIMTNYYFDNLTLSEVADNFSITRQAVSDSINQSLKYLNDYESKLHIIEKETLVLGELMSLREISTNDNLNNRIDKIIDDIRS